jgi:hypothetical protein
VGEGRPGKTGTKWRVNVLVPPPPQKKKKKKEFLGRITAYGPIPKAFLFHFLLFHSNVNFEEETRKKKRIEILEGKIFCVVFGRISLPDRKRGPS